MTDQPRPQPSLLNELLAIHRTLAAQLDPAGRQLLNRLDDLHNQDIVAREDRILAIAARLCAQIEEPDLFRRIFCEVWPGDVGPGDAKQFLARAIHGERA